MNKQIQEDEAFHHYLSTACAHNYHDACRLHCKYCNRGCICLCHGKRAERV